MTNKKGTKQTYTFKGSELFSFRFNNTRDGVIAAFRKQGIDFHLTIYKKDESLISHVVYKNKETGESKRTQDREFSIRDFLEQASKKLEKRIILPYDDQTKCYSFTEEYMEFILGKENEQGEQEIKAENALQVVYSNPDFSNKQNFNLINISQLFKTYPIGFIDVETEPKTILPISKEQMIVIPNDFISEIISIILEGLSFNTFIEEISKLHKLR